MALSNPLAGVGLDSYGDYYRFYRGLESINRSAVSDSAHNVVIHLAATGGFVLAILYLVILALALRSSIRILGDSQSFNWVRVALVATWIAYTTQSLISINQIGLAAWGWILAGTILGVDLNRASEEVPTRNLVGSRIKSPTRNRIFGVLTGFIALLIAVWPLRYDANFRTAFKSNDFEHLTDAALAYPQTNFHLVLAAQKLTEETDKSRAISLFRTAASTNYRDSMAWTGILKYGTVTRRDRIQVLARMLELDPKNPNIRKNYDLLLAREREMARVNK